MARSGIYIVIGLLIGASAAAAQTVVPQEPGPGTLNGANDCVLVSGPSFKKDELCPKHKYMRVCGAPSSNADRKRTCTNR